MSKHVTISPSEVADRLAIRELVDAFVAMRQVKWLFLPQTPTS